MRGDEYDGFSKDNDVRSRGSLIRLWDFGDVWDNSYNQLDGGGGSFNRCGILK